VHRHRSLPAAYGKGVVTCRTVKDWSAPAFFRVEGGSFGLQIGGQAVDLVMLVMNEQGMRNLLSSKFKIGADASAAAGPVGRHAEAATDWKMRAELLTYSRTRGLFAGISLNGEVVKQDEDDTRDFYGRMVPFRTILTGQITAPSGSEPLLKAAAKYAGPEPRLRNRVPPR
jgi:lipid-binding SYLF domain-containing protein